MNRQDHIRELEQRLSDLQARLPRHSVPMAMLIEIEELEDELAARRAQQAVDNAEHEHSL
ncbi:MAG: histidine kinase [Chloroflexi bacterium]|nr:histidine kinase [Chloroflexota bacterium]MBU1749978.1 histidine kinase [Chloroflexota bacterium]MBU1877891.1 histidine kinase [Chloroflexota bacterium]